MTVFVGRYTTTNFSKEVSVPAGTFQVMVSNNNDYTISGNGNIQ